jgi:hypothetical protein
MTYFPMGVIDAAKFNCTKYPGICKPMDFLTLDIVRDMQMQLNRIAKMKNLKMVAIDGDIGPGTMALAAKCDIGIAAGGPVSGFALIADVVRDTARAKADALGAPATVSGPVPAKAPTIINAAGVEIKAPPMVGASLVDSVKNLGMPTLLALGAAAIGAGYFLTKGSKKKPGIRYRTRTRTRYIRRYRSRR